MKKVLLTIFLLTIALITEAQISYYPAMLTRENGSEEKVFLRTKSKVLLEDQIIVYKSSDYIKETFKATQFSKLSTDDIELVTTTIPKIQLMPIILRKITKSSPELYEHIDKDGNKLLIIKSNETFNLLTKNKKGNLFGYKEWLFRNYNPQNKEASYFADLKYSKSSIAEYLYQDAEENFLTQEPKVDPFEALITVGYNINNFGVSDKDNFAFEDDNSNNLTFGLKGIYNIDRVTNRFSIIGGFNYQTKISGEGNSVLFPTSTTNRSDEKYNYDMQFVSFFIGPQFNIHFNHFSISPFISLEPTFLTVKKDNLILERNSINDADYITRDKRDNSIIFNMGISFRYKKVHFDFSYGSYSNLPLALDRGTDIGTYTIDLTRLGFSLGYNVF